MPGAAQRRVAIVGAGLAGLVAAVEASDAGAEVVVLERAAAPGGATAASAGWVWRYRDLATARACAPLGDPLVQAAIVGSLDEDLGWLEARGVASVAPSTGRDLTRGVRIDPAAALDRLAERLERAQPGALQVDAGVLDVRSAGHGFELVVRRATGAALGDRPVEVVAADAVVFAGGGYAADLDRVATDAAAPAAARAEWVLRAPRAGDGSSLDAALALGALRVPSDGESLVRLVPAGDGEPSASALVRAGELQVEGHRLVVGNDDLELQAEPHDWSGAQAAWRLARTCGAGRLELPSAALRSRIHAGGTVEEALRAAIADGAEGGRLEGGGAWLAVRAGITTTRCTLRVGPDGSLRVARRGWRMPGAPRVGRLDGAFAAGADAACSGLGGTASGLAQALVLGRRAARAAALGS